jgi:hypothetical protein
VSPVAACGCESEQDPQVVWNPPGLSNIAYRVDRFSGFRRALLEALPDETALLGWRPPAGDLGLQTLEWWAYLADILTFYNERIANESYLRCAQLPASVTGLVALLGYEPRPAIAAVGQVAAIRQTSRPHEPLVIPAGMQFSSTATPGVPVETFEAAAASFSGLSDVPIGLLPSTGAGSLLGSAPSGTGSIGSVLIAGHIGSLKPGDELLLASRVWSATSHDWAKVSVVSTTPEPDPNGGTNTRVALAAAQPAEVEEWLEEAAAADFRLLRPTQAAALWTQTATDQPLVETGATLVILLSAVVRGIAPGDLIFLDGSQGTAVGQVTDAAEKFGLIPYSGATPPNIQVARSVLTTLTPDAYGVVGAEPATVTVRFGLKDVGTLAPTPPTTLAALPATVSAPEGFTVAPAGASAFVEDATGVGIPVTATANADQTLTLAATAATPASFSLAAPLHLLVDLVDVSRGATVAAETLGSGDATVAGQSFPLKNSPLTYLADGNEYVSTLRVAVDGIYWSEAATFFGQPPDARIWVVSARPDGTSEVRFGDGINGARLPTGSQLVASYRFGAGAASPPAGRLTTILKPQQNLAAVHNPVAVWGGADAEQPADVRENAPASVLTFGRAISADDYETVAARAPGVSRARAYWTWDPARQRTLVKVYVGDDQGAAASARNALAGADDPNRPVAVTAATPIPLTLNCTLAIASDRVAADVVAAAKASLADPAVGLFSPANMAIGQELFVSQIEAALLVEGAVAVHALGVSGGGTELSGVVGSASPGEGAFFVLESSTITPVASDG